MPSSGSITSSRSRPAYGEGSNVLRRDAFGISLELAPCTYPRTSRGSAPSHAGQSFTGVDTTANSCPIGLAGTFRSIPRTAAPVMKLIERLSEPFARLVKQDTPD